MKMSPSEALFAKYLDDQNKAWVFQPRRFKLKNTTYRTDFYCPEENIYYEVIGTRQALSALKNKLREFIATYPRIKFKIVKPNGEDYYKGGLPPDSDGSQEIEKLIEIKKRRGLSYETMAYEIGVSFQTVLRWINKGDKPGSLALAQIRRFIKSDEAKCRKGNHGG